jgi:hypothetical protein
LTVRLRILQLDSLFRINHTDPWVGGDVHRTSRTINIQASTAITWRFLLGAMLAVPRPSAESVHSWRKRVQA